MGLKRPLTSRTHARNQGATGTAAQRPTAPSGGRRATHLVDTKGQLKTNRPTPSGQPPTGRVYIPA